MVASQLADTDIVYTVIDRKHPMIVMCWAHAGLFTSNRWATLVLRSFSGKAHARYVAATRLS